MSESTDRPEQVEVVGENDLLVSAIHNAPGIECSHVDSRVPTCVSDAITILSSDWLTQHDAALIERARAEGAAEGWERGYVDGLNDASLSEHDDGYHENPYARTAPVEGGEEK